ncbi:MAG: hypothetical protein IJD57_07000 [Candidatus Gastranaerophilales bacterium]|nr:hypothetical protein [Candidatus Gastranaerophilales bacterium]
MRRTILILFLILSQVKALTLDDLKEPRALMGRASYTETVEERKIEKQIVIQKQAQEEKVTQKTETIAKEKNENSTFADLSLKNIASEIADELNIDQSKINSDIAILWAATCERSETIKYTIYKLSNPDEDKPNDSAVKKILKPIANFGTLAGASFAGDPYLATGALIGGGLINAFTKDDKELNYRFSKVSDADMVLLVRKIDELQKKLLDLYVEYKTKEQIAQMAQDNYFKREEIYNKVQNLSKEELTIADAYYRDAKSQAQKAQDDFMISRSVLENLVGLEALKKIEE